jgi:hypothetical protein
MPSADAIADAETLLEMAAWYGMNDRSISVREAEVAGRIAQHLNWGGEFDGFEIYAHEASRAAFRACPGLRGE